jgi:hypothetical protein
MSMAHHRSQRFLPNPQTRSHLKSFSNAFVSYLIMTSEALRWQVKIQQYRRAGHSTAGDWRASLTNTTRQDNVV